MRVPACLQLACHMYGGGKDPGGKLNQGGGFVIFAMCEFVPPSFAVPSHPTADTGKPIFVSFKDDRSIEIKDVINLERE